MSRRGDLIFNGSQVSLVPSTTLRSELLDSPNDRRTFRFELCRELGTWDDPAVAKAMAGRQEIK